MASKRAKPASASTRRDTRLRFEQWARNPSCEANTLSAVHGIPMAEVARAEGGKATMGQSPFALARGQTFERGLFRAGADQLRKALVEADVLAPAARGFADFRTRQNGGKLADLDAALAATNALFTALAKAKAQDIQPSIVAAATIRIPERVMLPEAILVIDVLVIRWDTIGKRAELVVGEMKTYPDRGGHTDTAELATARAQAGVYVHGLDVTLAGLGLAARFTISRKGFLVLSRPGTNFPSVRSGEDLRFQAMRAERGFVQLERAADRLLAEEASIDSVRAASTTYESACISFCDRASTCFKKALDAGDAIILGEDVERFLGTVSLSRATALLEGAKAESDAERDVLEQLQRSI